MYTVERYNSGYFSVWNGFVASSKNGTFLFHRNFMEYHSDRFADFSLLVFDGARLSAILPAHIKDDAVYSHSGLTYGSLILPHNVTFKAVSDCFDAVLSYLKQESIKRLFIKQIPQVYFKQPSFEADYLCFEHKANLVSRSLNLAVDYNSSKWISKSKLKHFRKRADTGFHIEMGHDFAVFWEQVLIPRLQSRHNTNPVHTVHEITLLASRFPESIVQCNIYLEDEIVAGITLFIADGVVKSQYGATTEAGEKNRALDYLFITLLEHYKDKARYFDMGTVMERNGDINHGLLAQKEELGCTTYLQDVYEIIVP